MAPFTERRPWMIAPTETMPIPGSPPLSSSSRSSMRAGRRSRGSASSSAWSKPNPAAADSPRIAPIARPSVTRIRMGPWPCPVIPWNIEKTASPRTPPRPVGSGQRAVVGRADATAMAASAPTIHRKRRRRARTSGRPPIRRTPASAGGAMTAIEATPVSCIRISATMAPGRPRRLRTGPSMAWLRLGSWTDHVTSARPQAPAKPSMARPAISAARRQRKSRTISETCSKPDRLARVVRIRDPDARRSPPTTRTRQPAA